MRKKLIVLALVLLAAAAAEAALFNVNTETQLSNALVTASSNGEDDTVNVQAGTYILNGVMTYDTSEPNSLLLQSSGGEVILQAQARRIAYLWSRASDTNAWIDIDGITFHAGWVFDSWGAGAYIRTQWGDLTVRNSAFRDCRSSAFYGSSDYGGLIARIESSGTLSLLNTYFTNCTAKGVCGGAMLIGSGTADVVVRNNLFVDNYANTMAGGAYVNLMLGEGWIENNTFKDNGTGSGSGGGGLYVDTYRDGSSVTIRNNIFWSNRTQTVGADIYVNDDEDNNGTGATIVVSHNNFNDFDIGEGDNLTQASNIDADPEFFSDCSLQTSSPCINTGTNAAWMQGAVDLAGIGRVQASVVDMGAYEYEPDLTDPAVTIDSPTAAASYGTTNEAIDLGGTASDNRGVASVTWVNDRGGAGACDGTVNWSVSGASLQPGTNILTITAADAAGNTDDDVLIVTLNRTPTMEPPDTFVAKTLELFQEDITAVDADGTVPALSCPVKPVGAVFTDNGDGTGTFEWTPATNDVGSHILRFVAGDGALSDTNETEILVVPNIPWPSGDAAITNRGITFVWEDVAGATWYQLWIRRDGKTYYAKWLNQGEPLWTPDSDLPAGSYSWWVRPYDPVGGIGAWNAGAAFAVPLVIPGAAVLQSPSGSIAEARPTFEWDAGANAAWYRVWITRSGSRYHDKWVQDTNYLVTVDLPYGSYEWWVRTWAVDGYGPWSASETFARGVATQVSPAGVQGASPTALIWDDTNTDGATWYRYWINKDGLFYKAAWVAAGDTAPIGGVRSYDLPFVLPADDYRWWFQASKDGSSSPWSPGLDFTVP